MVSIYEKGGYIGRAGEYDLGGVWKIKSTNNRIVRDGLVLYLDAANQNSYSGTGTAWNDLSGKNNHGTLAGDPVFTYEKLGYFNFDGDDSVSFSSYSQPAYDTTTSFTWSIWVYPTRNADGDVLMGLRGTDLDFTKLTTFKFEYYSIFVGDSMPINIWQNVCVVKNQTNFYYYRNATEIETTTSGITKPSKSFYVGGDPSSGEHSVSRIAQVLVYDRALTVSELTQNYNATRNRFGI